MRRLPLLLSLITMVVLVAIWWKVTDNPQPTARASTPSQFVEQGDVLVSRLQRRLGQVWLEPLPVPDAKPLSDMQRLAQYDVQDGALRPTEGTKTSSVHQRSWSTVTATLPPELTSKITSFGLVTDGRGGARGWAQPLEGTRQWQLGLDPRDSEAVTRLNTLVYQSAFLVGLSGDQMQPLPTGDNCTTLQTSAGCLQQGSVMHRYVRTFWSDAMLRDWVQSGAARSVVGTQKFASLYPGTFFQPSAARSPESDFASAWTAFVLNPKPTVQESVLQRKMSFFYSDPALTELRLKILEQVSAAFPDR